MQGAAVLRMFGVSGFARSVRAPRFTPGISISIHTKHAQRKLHVSPITEHCAPPLRQD